MQRRFIKSSRSATGGVKSVKPPSIREPTVPLRPLPYQIRSQEISPYPTIKGRGLRGTVGSLDAKHLVDGKPLKQSLPLISGNFDEELG